MAFSLFHDILQLDKFEGADFKYDNIFFQIPAQKYPNHTFLIPNLDSFIFLSNLQLEKFEGADFKYVNKFFSNCSPKIPKWSIFCPKCKYFLILHEASHIEKFEGTD